MPKPKKRKLALELHGRLFDGQAKPNIVVDLPSSLAIMLREVAVFDAFLSSMTPQKIRVTIIVEERG